MCFTRAAGSGTERRLGSQIFSLILVQAVGSQIFSLFLVQTVGSQIFPKAHFR